MKKKTLLLIIAVFFLFSCEKEVSDNQMKDYLLGRKLSMENKNGEALPLLAGVYKENPDYAQNAFLYGKLLYHNGKDEKAVEIWEAVYEENPYYGDNSKELARYYIASEEPERAEQIIRKALEWNGGDPVLLTLLSRVYSAGKDYENALNIMVQAESYLETMAEVPLEHARLLQNYGFYDKAVRSVEKAIALCGEKSSLGPALQTLKEKLEDEND